jgi:hypothetical protein
MAELINPIEDVRGRLPPQLFVHGQIFGQEAQMVAMAELALEQITGRLAPTW